MEGGGAGVEGGGGGCESESEGEDGDEEEVGGCDHGGGLKAGVCKFEYMIGMVCCVY